MLTKKKNMEPETPIFREGDRVALWNSSKRGTVYFAMGHRHPEALVGVRFDMLPLYTYYYRPEELHHVADEQPNNNW